MKNKSLSLLAFLLLFSFLFGTSQNASAAETGVDPESIPTQLSPGVEIYYPENPENLIEFYATDVQLMLANSLQKGTVLSSTETTDTTSRIYVNGTKHAGLHINLEIDKFGPRGTLVYTLFKDGKYYQTYVAYTKGSKYQGPKLQQGEYSLRLYCGNPDELEKGCVARASISVYFKKPF